MPQHPEVKIAVLIRYEHQVFLIRRKVSQGEEVWSAPGGALAYGESPEQCAIRKTQEETNMTITTDATFLTLTNDIFDNQGRHDVTIWIEGKYIEGESWLEEDGEIAACGWFPWSVLPLPLSLSFKNFLSQGFPWRREDWSLEIGHEHLEILRANLPHLLI